MGFIDNVKTKLKGKDEDDFEKAFRDGSWPEGVEDFAPLENTGSFLPATYDVDPLADSSLPGNALQREAPAQTESVVRSAGHQDAFVTVAAPAAAPAPSPEPPAQAGAPQHLHAAAPVPAVDNVLEFKPRTAAAVSAENLTDEEFNARLRERRENRIAEARAREEARAAARAAEDEAHREHVAAVAAATPEVVVDEKADVLKPGRPVPCLALRPRSYDDVHQIVQCVKGEGRPCVLVMGGCTAELGQRILDFTFGLCCGTGAEFCTLNGFSKVYGAFPKGTTLAEADKTGLARMGIQIRG